VPISYHPREGQHIVPHTLLYLLMEWIVTGADNGFEGGMLAAALQWYILALENLSFWQ
jgi:hypothetical protein